MDRTDLLPDSRTKRPTGAFRGPHGNWVPIYCANCGAPGGSVPEENMTFVFWLCENCFETHGKIAATMAVPDDLFWQMIREKQEEKKRKETLIEV